MDDRNAEQHSRSADASVRDDGRRVIMKGERRIGVDGTPRSKNEGTRLPDDLVRRSNLHQRLGSLISTLRHIRQLGLIHLTKLAVLISKT